MNVTVFQLPHGEGLPLPSYATSQSAGLDLYAAVKDSVVIAPQEFALIPTGLSIILPSHTEAQIRSRSGLAFKHGIAVLNSPGTIDADYRGEVGILLINHGKEPFTVERGMRIAQMVIAEFKQITWQPCATETEWTAVASEDRGGGFGSTGMR